MEIITIHTTHQWANTADHGEEGLEAGVGGTMVKTMDPHNGRGNPTNHPPIKGTRELEQKPTRRKGCRGWSKKKKRKLDEGVYNLTEIVFTQEELLVLDKGIKYAPSKSFNQFEAFIDLQKFVRF